MSSFKNGGGKFTRNAKETASFMLDTFFPKDDARDDNEIQGLIRQAVTFIAVGRAKERGFSQSDIQSAIDRINPRKAPGWDEIPGDAVKRTFYLSGDIFIKKFNECLAQGVFPKCWKIQVVRCIPKISNEDLTDPRSFRPFSLLPVVGKVLDRLTTDRAAHLAVS